MLNCLKMVKLDPDLTVNARINNDRYNFRSDMKVAVPKHRLTMVAKSPLVLPIKLFNKLPLSYKQIIKSAKIFVKTCLIENSIEEFVITHN